MNTKRLEELYPLCIAGDEKARGEFCDAAGVMAGLHWSSGLYPCLNVNGHYQTGVWLRSSNTSSLLWAFYGRHAPLLSLDCAATIPMPVGYTLNWAEDAKRVALYNPDGLHLIGHSYNDPTERPMAEAFARVWANCHAKEKETT